MPASKTDIVARAKECFRVAEAAEADQRKREQEALQFQVPELQWPDEVKRQRAATTVNGIPIPARPMLSIPKLDQPIQLVLNQERSAHLGVQVHPLTEDSDEETADILQGLYRRIEVDSRANLARSWAFERAVKAGRGWYRVLTEYDPNASDPKDQRIVIRRILDQGRVYIDPFHQEPDASDAMWGMVVDDIPWESYKAQYKNSKMADYDDEDFEGLGSEAEGWVTNGPNGEARKVRVAEYFYVDYEAQGEDENRRYIKWCKVNAIEELDSADWPGQWIPLIPVIGHELIPFRGQRRWQGIIEPNMDAQRLFNYAASGSVEMSALETKATHAVDPEAIEGFESWWQQKNYRNFPYLPYKRMIGGRDLGPPEPIQADMSKMQMNAILLQQAGDFIHAGTGAFEPTLGDTSPREKSGKAILSLQQQHDQGNYHWLDSMAEISMTHEARVVLDLIPHIYDRPGRIARILDLDGDKPQTVMLNQPYVMQNGQPQAVNAPRSVGMGQTPAAAANAPMQPQGPPQPQVKHYDLSKGRYGVTVSIGKAYKSRVEQGRDQLGQLFQAEPQLFPILGDIWLKFTDFPGHLEASERVKKMLPPQLQAQEGPEAAAQQIPVMQAQIQALTAKLQEAEQYITHERAKHEAAIATANINADKDLAITVMNNAAKIATARLTAAKAAYDSEREGQEETMALGLQHAFDAHQAQQDRDHEAGMAQMQHQQALEQGAQGAQADAMQSAQDHGQALEQNDQAHQQALEQGDQQIAGTLAAQEAKPQPGAGQ